MLCEFPPTYFSLGRHWETVVPIGVALPHAFSPNMGKRTHRRFTSTVTDKENVFYPFTNQGNNADLFLLRKIRADCFCLGKEAREVGKDDREVIFLGRIPWSSLPQQIYNPHFRGWEECSQFLSLYLANSTPSSAREARPKHQGASMLERQQKTTGPQDEEPSSLNPDPRIH
jgi:hypothetical protein